jgi:N-acetylglutamate synthase-like GNAT family acetyltransferase
MDVFVREAKKDDLQAVLELYKQLHPEDLPSPPERELKRIWSRMSSSPVVHCYVAEQEGKIVATGTLAVLPNLTRGGRPYGLIENVVTDKDFQRRGIGKQLVHYILREAERLNCYKVMVLTDVYRQGTVEFYKTVGFKTGLKNGLVWLSQSVK